MNTIDYNTNFESNEEIVSKIETKVKLFVYDTHGESYNEKTKRWEHDEPRKTWINLEDILYFRLQNESDNYKDNTDTIGESTYMPTEWCMMVYHEDYSKSLKVIPVVGNYKEMNKRLEYLKNEYYKHSDRLDKLKGDIKEIYLTKEIDKNLF